MDFNRLSLLSFSFCSIKATRPKICKKSVCCFYCITMSLWRTKVNHLKIRTPMMRKETMTSSFAATRPPRILHRLSLLSFSSPSETGHCYVIFPRVNKNPFYVQVQAKNLHLKGLLYKMQCIRKCFSSSLFIYSIFTLYLAPGSSNLHNKPG